MVTRSSQKHLLVAMVLAVVLVFCSHYAAGQAGSQGSVVITVSDTSGGVIPEAGLTLIAQRTNDKRTATTEGNGSCWACR